MARTGVVITLFRLPHVYSPFEQIPDKLELYSWYFDDGEGLLTYKEHSWWWDFKDKVMIFKSSRESWEYEY